MGLLRVVILAALAGVCVAACGSCEGDDAVDAPGAARRTVSFAWKVVDLSDLELACDRIDAQLVTVTLFRIRTGEGFTEVFDCFRKTGTKELEDGAYMIGFELGDRFGTLLTVAPRRYEVTADGALDEVKFRIDPFGNLIFTIDTGLPANCASSTQITGMTISLAHSNGLCEGTTLAIEPSTSYTINCVSPNVAGCIEKDRRVTATHIPADDYRIRIVASQGPTACWLLDQRQRVRAGGFTRTLALTLAKTCN